MIGYINVSADHAFKFLGLGIPNTINCNHMGKLLKIKDITVFLVYQLCFDSKSFSFQASHGLDVLPGTTRIRRYPLI